MRAVESMWYRNFLSNLNISKERFDETITQHSTGKKINKLSDNPSDMAYVLDLRDRVEQAEQFGKNIDSGLKFLMSTDSALNGVMTRMYEIISKSEEGASETTGLDGRKTIANSIEMARDALMDLANTKINGRYIFAGSAGNKQPFVMANSTTETLPDGRVIDVPGDITYEGNSDIVQIQADFSVKVNTNVPGDEAFGMSGGFTDLFETLQLIVRDLRADDTPSIGRDISRLNETVSQINETIGKIGNNMSQMREIKGQLEHYKTAMKANKSSLEDANMAEVISNLAREGAVLKSILSSGSRIQQQTLMDYI